MILVWWRWFSLVFNSIKALNIGHLANPLHCPQWWWHRMWPAWQSHGWWMKASTGMIKDASNRLMDQAAPLIIMCPGVPILCPLGVLGELGAILEPFEHFCSLINLKDVSQWIPLFMCHDYHVQIERELFWCLMIFLGVILIGSIEVWSSDYHFSDDCLCHSTCFFVPFSGLSTLRS